MIKSVEYGIKPLTLSNSQIKQLEKQFQIQKDIKSARKLRDRVCKTLNKTFFTEQKL